MVEERDAPAPRSFVDEIAFDDAIELAEYARTKLGKKKIVLMGQSTGSLLGLKVAQKRPERA